MSDRFVPHKVLVVGVDPHRERLDVIGICFPEDVVLDETFKNTRAGHETLWSKAQGLVTERDLRLVFGLEDGSNYGYTLGRYLVRQGCQVKEVNPRMTNRPRDFYGQDKTNRLDALATAATVVPAHEQLPDLTAVEKATQATQELSRYHEQLVREQTATVNRLHCQLANQYPGYKSFFSVVHGVTALYFWAAYPTPAHLRSITPEQLADFLFDKSHHCLSQATCLQKASHILRALDDWPVHEPNLPTQAQAAIIGDMAQRLLQLKRSIEAVQTQLQEICRPLTSIWRPCGGSARCSLPSLSVRRGIPPASIKTKTASPATMAALRPPGAQASTFVRSRTIGAIGASKLLGPGGPHCLPPGSSVCRVLPGLS